MKNNRPFKIVAKRIIDLIITLPLCIVLSPLFLIIALTIKLGSRGPIIFKQDRWGINRQRFTMYKFRTLQHNASDPHEKYEMVETDPRITPIGMILRKTSLDELPQVFNVIIGNMSLVGPRPLVEWESKECLINHSERFLVKPGITGLSQVNVRNSVDLSARSDWDVEYVRHWSILLDIKIIVMSALNIVLTKGIYPNNKIKGEDSI